MATTNLQKLHARDISAKITNFIKKKLLIHAWYSNDKLDKTITIACQKPFALSKQNILNLPSDCDDTVDVESASTTITEFSI